MTMLDLHMKLFGWFYRWKTMQDSINKMKLRSREEILIKKQEFENKLLLAQKSEKEPSKYQYYLEVMRWILKES